MKQTNRQQLLAEIKAQLTEHFPRLHLYHEQGVDLVRGVFPVRLSGEVIDRYLIEIALPENYPHDVPFIKELRGDAYRVDPNRHVYVGKYRGYLCLFFRDERWKYWPEGASFLDFLNNPLNDYFLGQLYYEAKGHYPFGERGHGAKAVIEYYSEELESKNIQLILRFLRYLSKPMKKGKHIVKGHWPCYCGSGKKLRDCHYPNLIDLRDKIPWDAALISLNMLIIYIVGIIRAHKSPLVRNTLKSNHRENLRRLYGKRRIS